MESELAFLESLAKEKRNYPPEVLCALGDDCSVRQMNDNKVELVTKDLLLDQVHFVLEKVTPWQLGYKSLAVNLSDIAAMGGEPKAYYVGLALPKNTSRSFLAEFYQGMRSLAEEFSVSLLGGDTTSSSTLMISITVIGEMPLEEVLYRQGAQVGDVICVTGELGDSAAGWEILSYHQQQQQRFPLLVNQHLLPRPCLREGRWLARKKKVHAMIDISDGVASDLKHICHHSQVGAEIDLDALPLSEEFQEYIKTQPDSCHRLALAGGEDYQLLFTIAQESFPSLQQQYEDHFLHPFYAIGRVISEKKIYQLQKDKPAEELAFSGWDHFQTDTTIRES